MDYLGGNNESQHGVEKNFNNVDSKQNIPDRSSHGPDETNPSATCAYLLERMVDAIGMNEEFDRAAGIQTIRSTDSPDLDNANSEITEDLEFYAPVLKKSAEFVNNQNESIQVATPKAVKWNLPILKEEILAMIQKASAACGVQEDQEPSIAKDQMESEQDFNGMFKLDNNIPEEFVESVRGDSLRVAEKEVEEEFEESATEDSFRVAKKEVEEEFQESYEESATEDSRRFVEKEIEEEFQVYYEESATEDSRRFVEKEIEEEFQVFYEYEESATEYSCRVVEKEVEEEFQNLSTQGSNEKIQKLMTKDFDDDLHGLSEDCESAQIVLSALNEKLEGKQTSSCEKLTSFTDSNEMQIIETELDFLQSGEESSRPFSTCKLLTSTETCEEYSAITESDFTADEIPNIAEDTPIDLMDSNEVDDANGYDCSFENQTQTVSDGLNPEVSDDQDSILEDLNTIQSPESGIEFEESQEPLESKYTKGQDLKSVDRDVSLKDSDKDISNEDLFSLSPPIHSFEEISRQTPTTVDEPVSDEDEELVGDETAVHEFELGTSEEQQFVVTETSDNETEVNKDSTATPEEDSTSHNLEIIDNEAEDPFRLKGEIELESFESEEAETTSDECVPVEEQTEQLDMFSSTIIIPNDQEVEHIKTPEFLSAFTSETILQSERDEESLLPVSSNTEKQTEKEASKTYWDTMATDSDSSMDEDLVTPVTFEGSSFSEYSSTANISNDENISKTLDPVVSALDPDLLDTSKNQAEDDLKMETEITVQDSNQNIPVGESEIQPDTEVANAKASILKKSVSGKAYGPISGQPGQKKKRWCSLL